MFPRVLRSTLPSSNTFSDEFGAMIGARLSPTMAACRPQYPQKSGTFLNGMRHTASPFLRAARTPGLRGYCSCFLGTWHRSLRGSAMRTARKRSAWSTQVTTFRCIQEHNWVPDKSPGCLLLSKKCSTKTSLSETTPLSRPTAQTPARRMPQLSGHFCF
jgi:hypothetical protein